MNLVSSSRFSSTLRIGKKVTGGNLSKGQIIDGVAALGDDHRRQVVRSGFENQHAGILPARVLDAVSGIEIPPGNQ